MAAIGENQQKGTRKSGFKVKSGCINCKSVCFTSPLYIELNGPFTDMRFLFCSEHDASSVMKGSQPAKNVHHVAGSARATQTLSVRIQCSSLTLRDHL